MGFKGGQVIGTILFNNSGSATTTIGNNSGGAVSILSNSSLTLRMNSGYSLSNSSTIVESVTNAGQVTQPLQPAFLGLLSADDDNRTGNGTNYILGTNVAFTKIYDQNNNFTTGGVFTAPITGVYLFVGAVSIGGSGSTTTATLITFDGSNRDMFPCNQNSLIPTGATAWSGCASSYLDMDIGDTCVCRVRVTGLAGDTADIQGNSTNGETYFGGKLMC